MGRASRTFEPVWRLNCLVFKTPCSRGDTALEKRKGLDPQAQRKEARTGIPNVVDRWVAQAILQVLAPFFEPEFHPSSHGFRPGKSCHTALDEASRQLATGRRFVVDIDLEDFFNRVHHQRLMARLERRISDRRILRVILDMLKASIVLPDGVGRVRNGNAARRPSVATPEQSGPG